MLLPDRRGRALAALVAGALALVALPGTAVAAPTAGSNGLGDPYFPLDGNGGIDVSHYDIHDRYRFRSRRLSGHTTLTVTATQRLSSFNLDFLLPVSRVRLDGARVDYSRPHRHELRIEPDRTLQAGQEFTVRVTYSGRPGRYGYGGERNWLANRHEVVAMNQPHMAPWWFPANDHPADKAAFDISITVPRDRQVVANGRRIDRVRHQRTVTHHWRSADPMATYLATFAAGRFGVDRGRAVGVPMRLLVSRRLSPGERRASLRLLRRTPHVLAELESDLGPYPFESVGGLVTALPVGFALENQTLPTYPHVGGGGWTWLIVHEQAHQWFGDSVTIERWRDIWLNEGAASFMEVRYASRNGGPPANRWLRRRYDGLGAGSGFWDLAIGDPGRNHIFDNPVYARGAMTFQALRNRIGNQQFWTLLRTWLTDHAGGNASTADFFALAEQVSGEQLDGFFDAWLGTGKPADTAANGLG